MRLKKPHIIDKPQSDNGAMRARPSFNAARPNALRWFGLCWAGLCIFATQAACEDPPARSIPARIVAFQVIPNGDVTCFEVISIGHLTGDVYRVAGPARIVIDVPTAMFDLKRRPQKMTDGVVSAFRFGALSENSARIVLDVDPKTEISDVSRSVIDSNGFRLSVELRQGAGPLKARCRSEASRKRTAEWAKALTVTTGSKQGTGKPVVVLDPGHGGIDPGAVVNKNYLEKTIVLAVAKRVARLLRQRGGVQVIMTRNDDTFVPLDGRIERSRAGNANLFVSLHADSIDDPTQLSAASGAAIYTLSSRASDAEARRFAEKENASDRLAGILPKVARDESPVRNILVDLLKRETERGSARLSNLLIKAMRGRVPISRRPRRSAAFHVLKQTETPGVLIELGYMTNPRDLRLMRQADWQQAMARAIANAVHEYYAIK